MFSTIPKDYCICPVCSQNQILYFIALYERITTIERRKEIRIQSLIK